MKNYDAVQAISIISKAAQEYDKKLKDKHFLIVYQNNNEMRTSCIGFRDMNFLHLTGVKTNLKSNM